jgi:DNA-binding GntR family transcriptional regulator
MLDMRGGRDTEAAAAAQKPSLVGGAYESLKEAIRNNTFAPGYQGSEQEIASQLGMSRTPVHEAIIRLQEEGLIRVLPRRGVVVCAISPEDMREIYEVIIALETTSAELLAEKPADERVPIVEELSSLNVRMQSALAADDLVEWAKADERFHQLLVERSGNGRLARMFHTIMDQSHRARMLTLRLRPKPTASAREHQAIVDAIGRGDAQAARERAKRHRVGARDQLLPLLGQFGMKHL